MVRITRWQICIFSGNLCRNGLHGMIESDLNAYARTNHFLTSRRGAGPLYPGRLHSAATATWHGALSLRRWIPRHAVSSGRRHPA